MILKSDVNLQVTLKQNRTYRNGMKGDMPLLETQLINQIFYGFCHCLQAASQIARDPFQFIIYLPYQCLVSEIST